MPGTTIRQLAEIAGCSRTTVSLALRNHPRIPAKTRQRIDRLARKMGYARDPVISTLMTRIRATHQQRSVEKLAYLSWWAFPQSEARAPAVDTLGFASACRRARELGYEIEEFWARAPGLTTERLNKILYTRGIRGALIGSLPRPLGHVRLEWSRLATVALGFNMANHGIHRVGASHFQGMRLAIRHLRHRGYKRIGFASLTSHTESSNQGWLGGFLTFQHRLARDLRLPPLITADWSKKRFQHWIETYRPDVVISNMDTPLLYLHDLGYRLPRDIGFASLDRMYPTDRYAGINTQRAEINIAAVELLASLVENNQFGLSQHPRVVHIEGVWTDGPTVRPLPHLRS